MQVKTRTIMLVFVALFGGSTGKANIYQAETASLHKAVVETKNSGYIGEAYINFDNEPGSSLQIAIGLLAAGEQTISIRYANGGTSGRPMEMVLNGSVVVDSLVFNPTGTWTSWDTVSVDVIFKDGINTLMLTSLGDEGGPNIDQFEVSGDALPHYSLNLSVQGNGHVEQEPGNGLLFLGQKIVLVAKPGFSSVFQEWTGDASGTKDTLMFEMDSDKNIQAIFLDIQVDIPEPDFSMAGFASVSDDGIETTTGGAGGNVLVIETLGQLKAWGASREDNYAAEIVVIKGLIEAETTEVITIKRGKDISIVGDTESNGGFAELKNISINIRDYSNVIVRNLKMHEVFYPNDDLTIDHCDHVWVDHCEFYSKIGPGIGVDTYDGLLDIKKGSNNVTVSWCHFHDHMKTVLVGHSDNNGDQDAGLQMTFHHNWFSNTDGRNPSLRFGLCHYYNNYLENISDYGFAARNGAHAKIENCHFESVNQPIVTDKFQGHGFACVSGCIYTGDCSEGDNQISEPLDCSFWDNQIPYDYTLEDVNSVMLSVQAYAGVGKIDHVTSSPIVANQPSFEIRNLYFDKSGDRVVVSLFSPRQQDVSFSVYTLEGKRVCSRSEKCLPGVQKIVVGGQLPKGILLVRIETMQRGIGKKVVVY